MCMCACWCLWNDCCVHFYVHFVLFFSFECISIAMSFFADQHFHFFFYFFFGFFLYSISIVQFNMMTAHWVEVFALVSHQHFCWNIDFSEWKTFVSSWHIFLHFFPLLRSLSPSPLTNWNSVDERPRWNVEYIEINEINTVNKRQWPAGSNAWPLADTLATENHWHIYLHLFTQNW